MAGIEQIAGLHVGAFGQDIGSHSRVKWVWPEETAGSIGQTLGRAGQAAPEH